MTHTNISFVIPALNEKENILAVYNSIKESMSIQDVDAYQIVFVNDGSTDGTLRIINELQERDEKVILANHVKSKGLGVALCSGFQLASGDYVITIDADLTHSLDYLPFFLEKIQNHDIVIGSRYVKGGSMVNVPIQRIIVSRLANFVLANLFQMSHIRDISSGYRCYRAEAIKSIEVVSKGFSCQFEILVKARRKKMRIAEIPIVLTMRNKGQSKFNLFKVAKDYIRTAAILYFNRR